MELLDRYLKAVRFWLPKAQRQDVIRELSEDIRSQIDERQAELGRKLTETELETMLLERGRPVLVAGRYAPDQYLIGPAFLRMYRFALKWILLPIAIITVSPLGILTPLQPPSWLTLAFWLIWRTTIYTFGIFTLVLALQERFRSRLPGFWRPSYLRSVDHYLYLVKAFLPKAERDDIAEELAEDIRSEIEDREAELGQPLDKHELAAVLRKRGHPIAVADHFLPQEYLIGPAWFPVYRFALKAVLLILAVVIVFVIAPVKIANDPVKFRAVAEALVELWQTSVYSVGLLTLFFATLDHFHVSFALMDLWRRRRELATVAARPIPRPQPASSPIFWSVFIAWWLALEHFPVLLFGPAASHLRFSAGWQTFHTPILLVALAALTHRLANLARPEWTRVLLAGRTVLNTAAVVTLLLLVRTYPFVVTAEAVRGSAYYEYLAQFFSASLLFGVLAWTAPWMLVAGVVYAWQCAAPLFRRARARPEERLSRSL